jgi:hypothetical protein
MSSLSIIDDSMVTRSDVLARTLPVILTGSKNFNTDGFGEGNSMYFICNPSAAMTITLPVNYAAYKGKVLHFSLHAAQNLAVPASGASSGVVTGLNGSSVNGTNLLTAAGSFATLVCDGSSSWIVVMRD